jgi:hypothetical protein
MLSLFWLLRYFATLKKGIQFPFPAAAAMLHPLTPSNARDNQKQCHFF